MANIKKDVDWIKLEVDYRAGKSFRVLAKEYGISSTRIAQVADENNWVRDLSAVIAERTRSKLNAANLNAKRQAERREAKDAAKAMIDEIEAPVRKATERDVIEATAEVQVDVVLRQRKNIGRYATLAMRLMEELELQTDKPELLEALAIDQFNPDKNGNDKLNELYKHIISMPGRVDSLKKLSETLKTLVALERQAYNIQDGDGGDKQGDGLSRLLDFVASRGSRLPIRDEE